MLAQLIPMKGGPPITLTKGITVVGRSSSLCDLVINHHSVSKMHCILVKTDGLIYVRDLGSTNGTRVNGQRVIRGALLPGDRLSFSGAVYKIHLGPDPPPGVVTADGRTEVLPVIAENSLLLKDLGNDQTLQSSPKPSSRRKKNMGDSDLLPPD